MTVFEWVLLIYLTIAFAFFLDMNRRLLKKDMRIKYSGLIMRTTALITIIFFSLFWIVFVIMEIFLKRNDKNVS